MFLPLLLINLRFPVLKIDVASCCVHVVGDVPGNRSDEAVPRPYRRTGMAVVAGPFQNSLNFRGHVHVRFETARRDHGRVRPARLNDLNEDQKRDRTKNNPFCRNTSHRKVSPKVFEIIFARINYRHMFGMLAMGWQVPGPRSSVNFVKLKLNNSGLASGSMPGRCSNRVRVTGNFTPLPKLASSVSFFFPGERSILGASSDSPTCTVPLACLVSSAFKGFVWS